MQYIDFLLDVLTASNGGDGGGGYPEPTGSITITQNGTHDVKDKAQAVVNVPNPSTGALEITENGTYDVTAKAQAVVTVSGADKSVGLVDGTATAYESDDVLSVRAQAFQSHPNLASVSLPNATSVGASAFRLAPKLAHINLPRLTTAAAYAFQDIPAVDIELPALETITGRYCFQQTYALTGAPFLKTLKLPSLRTLQTTVTQGNTCQDQAALELADFGLVEGLKQYDFSGCSSLTALILRRTANAATLANINALQNTPIRSGTGYIYVPRALADTYKAATNWSTVAAQFRALEDYTVDGTTTGDLDPTKI